MKELKIFIFGISGKVGAMLCERAELNGVKISGGFDIVPADGYPTFSDVNDVNVDIDVIIDFSRPETLDSVIALSRKYKAPVVYATTGITDADRDKLTKLSKDVPVVLSGNMSVGINVMNKLVALATKLLGSAYDIEIIEKHHNRKVDAPSGTAMMLAKSVENEMTEPPEFVYGRQGVSKRNKNDVTIHAVRGGTIVGEHDVMFCGEDETLTISHTALSRRIFVDGAYRAAKFLTTASPALYGMNSVLDGKNE